MPKDVILTAEGLANLKAELDLLSTTRRREVAARIKEAREFGDISENAEYDDAKNEQAMLEARIAQLEDKLRSGQRPGDLCGVEVARRLADSGSVAGLCVHPRHATQRHKGSPDYDLVRRLVEELPVPVMVSGGLESACAVRAAFERTGAAGVLLARGSLGNPWLFSQVLGLREGDPDRAEILAELDWVIDAAVSHLGRERATRYLRKFYPWYVERLGGGRALQAALQVAPTLEAARALLWGEAAAVAA